MGSIVWVRRRNGSWWPGKILSPDEISNTHLMSPRSGTPVKLLGREDASVDWYNLEKSKRVKAFRCGEFDECIEKAEASLGLPTKKREREKYARRDDAILHALRLEKEFLEKKYGNAGDSSISVKNNSSDYTIKDLASAPGTLENGTGEHGSHKLLSLHRKTGQSAGSGSSNFPSSSSSQKVRNVDLEVPFYSEVKPQRRDMQSLGMKTVQPKLMASLSAAVNDSHELMVDDEGRAFESTSDADSENTSGRGKGLMHGQCGFNQEFRTSTNWHTDYSRGVGNYAQARRSTASDMPSESNYNAGMKGGPSGRIEIFGSHSQKGAHHSGKNGLTGKLPCATSEDTESDSSETDSEEHAMDAEMKTNSGTFTPVDLQSRPLDGQDRDSLSSEDEDYVSPDYTPQFHPHDSVSVGRMSRWQLKRKRNVRSSPRKSIDRLTSTSYANVGGRQAWRRANDSMSYYHDNNGFPSDVEFFDDDVVHTPMIEREHGNNRGYLSNPQSAIRSHHSFVGDNRFCGGGYWGRSGFNSFFYGGRHPRNMLVDVDLRVEAAQHRRDERVPWVSLTSRLNGNAIVGYPIGVEKLEDGATDSLLSTVNGFGSFEFNNYRNNRAWKATANVQVQTRPVIFSSDPAGEDDNHHLYRDQDQGLHLGRTAVAGLPAQRNSQFHKAPSNKNKKKVTKKSSSSSSLKIRPLTSIGIGQSLVADDNYDDNDYMDLGSGPPPTVACIPLKLVFSRLLEAVGKPPSGPVAGFR